MGHQYVFAGSLYWVYRDESLGIVITTVIFTVT